MIENFNLIFFFEKTFDRRYKLYR